MIVKVCGMRDSENIRSVELSGADLMGFIFFPDSPRHVASKPAYMPKLQKRVGVFVNAEAEEIIAKAKEYRLDLIQLHGNETPQFCNALKERGLGVIRATGIASADDARRAADYGMADLMIFDAKTPLHGGSGQTFNWNLIDSYRGSVPFLLSGGIGPQAAESVRAFSHPLFAGVDLNSGFETAPALKDAEKLTEFIQQIKAPKPQQPES